MILLHLFILSLLFTILFLLEPLEAMAISLKYASAKNKQPILDILKPKIDEYCSKMIGQNGNERIRLLEIASGTGESMHIIGLSYAFFC